MNAVTGEELFKPCPKMSSGSISTAVSFLRRIYLVIKNGEAVAFNSRRVLVYIIFWFPSLCVAYDTSPLEAKLTNIRQVTFASMGFEKAGEAYFSPDGKDIVFQAVPIGKTSYQIYMMNIREGIPRMVSTGRGSCTCAYFRPDGKRIIFSSSHSDPILDSITSAPGYKRGSSEYAWAFTPYMNIYETNLDGSKPRPLTKGVAYHAECAYSPDGSRIVFASNESGSMNIYTMNVDGSDVRQVTHDIGVYNGGPFFSPNGKEVIYRADHERQHYLQIYLINADGTNRRQLTKNGAVNWAPYWHPNGELIAYTTSLHGHNRYAIHLLNIRTGISERLTYGLTFDGIPAFSNDGKKILWTSKRGIDGTCQIFVADFTYKPLGEPKEKL